MNHITDGLPKTGKEAREVGSNKYNTGLPCKYGHFADRYSHNGQCCTCGYEAATKHRASVYGKEYGKVYYKTVKKDSPETIMLMSAKARAKKFSVPFSISKEDIRSVIADTCPVLGIPLMHNSGTSGGYADNSPSLDRIVPELGYVVGNIAVISMKANRIKSNENDPATFRKIADWIENKGG